MSRSNVAKARVGAAENIRRSASWASRTSSSPLAHGAGALPVEEARRHFPPPVRGPLERPPDRGRQAPRAEPLRGPVSELGARGPARLQRPLEVGEGGHRVVEEHHTEARHDRVEARRLERVRLRVGDDEQVRHGRGGERIHRTARYRTARDRCVGAVAGRGRL